MGSHARAIGFVETCFEDQRHPEVGADGLEVLCNSSIRIWRLEHAWSGNDHQGAIRADFNISNGDLSLHTHILPPRTTCRRVSTDVILLESVDLQDPYSI
jgi:hypothetical protein